jgi:hypothetical protein
MGGPRKPHPQRNSTRRRRIGTAQAFLDRVSAEPGLATSGKLQVEGKDDAKKRDIRSPTWPTRGIDGRELEGSRTRASRIDRIGGSQCRGLGARRDPAVPGEEVLETQRLIAAILAKGRSGGRAVTAPRGHHWCGRDEGLENDRCVLQPPLVAALFRGGEVYHSLQQGMYTLVFRSGDCYVIADSRC